MWSQFLLENGHFAINLVTGLVMLSVFWLYFDVWFARVTKVEGFKAAGFLLLSISYFIHAIFIETTILPVALLPDAVNSFLFFATKDLGFIFLIIGQLLEPVELEPKVKGLSPDWPKKFSAVIVSSGVAISALLILDPILSGVVAFLYLRRAYIGLEHHLPMVGLAFAFLTLSSLLHLATLWQSSTNPLLYNLVAPFGPIWIAELLSLLVGSIILGCWVFSYLWKRLLTQLIILAELTILILFLLITMTFSALILNNLQNQSELSLQDQTKVTNLAIDSKKSELLSYAKLTAQNPQIIQAVGEKNSPQLNNLIDNFFLLNKEDSLILTDANGQIITRAEDKERVGNSISDDPQIKKALAGQDSFSLVTTQNPVVPQISIQVATPIENNQKVIGVVMSDFLIDNDFVDRIRGDLSSEVSVFSADTLSATSLTSDNQLRPVGIKEDSSQVKSAVLTNGGSFAGAVTILNSPYLAYFLPLKDVDGHVVGMLSLEQSEGSILQTAGQTIGLTFMATLLFLLLSLIPVYLISKYLAHQFKK